MIYMDGVRLNDVAKLKELGVDMQALVESITRSYAHQIYVDGFFNADPHPGQRYLSKLVNSNDCQYLLCNFN
jgi:predicted unusual protein kinase regulating ubiquinone biosynthesis (AarF/ABC1/UbiB family)